MIVYDGPSVLNEVPIVGIITGLTSKSNNPKTGPMAQLWILHQDEAPHLAVKSGADASVCGDCPARNKWCYVQTFQGPRSVWAAWKRGSYPPHDPLLLQGKALRLGAYGDPAALPLSVLKEITKDVDMYTGYTHAWKYCDDGYQHFCMASCDSREDAVNAIGRGWRTFRVTEDAGDKELPNEIICPASDEADQLLTCITCKTCDGNRRGLKSNVVIKAHVNQHNIKANAKGADKPVLTVKDYQHNRKGNLAIILDHNDEEVARVIYQPDNPLPCGARCWIETKHNVDVYL